ncbi:ATP-grasp ribosomal peptide maturase [Streptomyces sp. NPDC006784]|uniref:ATP-grasp ribosomal peptide maturase n=1 Tax=Streptomyces sp. NPDC006784 TaxID=3364764 RepID=UPI00368E5133
MPASVAIITRDQDTAADLVVHELRKRDAVIYRFDLADFPTRMTQAAYLIPGRARWTGALKGQHRDVDLSGLTAVWYRKPSTFRLHQGMSATEQEWAATEARAGFGGQLAALPGVRWINHPHRNAEADHKPLQLARADACGLAVPESLLTNDPDAARAFCHAHHDTGVIYKPLHGGPANENGQPVALWATSVTADDITDGVARSSHLFQARIPCAYAVRLTVVGEQMFAVRIDAPEDSAAVDWRQDHDQLRYTPIDVPDDVAAGTRQLLQSFGLTYAAIDWVVTPDGQWTFIGDLNPNGQWGWIQAHTGLPIAAAIADELARE